MGLSVKGAARQFGILAFAHDPLHVFTGPFQVTQDDAFELTADFLFARIRGRMVQSLTELLDMLQRQGEIAFEDFPAERIRSAEKAVGELFDLAHAQVPAADRGYELLDPVRD